MERSVGQLEEREWGWGGSKPLCTCMKLNKKIKRMKTVKYMNFLDVGKGGVHLQEKVTRTLRINFCF